MTDEKDVLPSDAENGSLKPKVPEDEKERDVPPSEKPKEQADPSKQPS